MVRLLSNDPAGARALFLKSVDTKLAHFVEYAMAKGELTRLATKG
jgi:hypothetical protein